MTSITIKASPLVITEMRDVSYLTTATQERQFLIEIPLKDGGHFTEMTTAKIEAGIDLPDLQVAPDGKQPFHLTVPFARVLNSTQDVSTNIRGKGALINQNIVRGYYIFAQRWTTRMDPAGTFLNDARHAASQYLKELYGRAGANVEFVDAPGQPKPPAALRQIEGALGDFQLDADFAAQVTHCPDLKGDCFQLGDESSRLKVKVFDTEQVESDDPTLSRLFDQSNPDHSITSAYLKDNSIVFFRWNVRHTLLYAITVEATDESRLGDVLPMALEMAFTFSPRQIPKDHCLSAGGVTLEQWRDLSSSMKRATWADDVDAFGAIWSHVPVKTDVKHEEPLVGTVRIVPESVHGYGIAVAVDQSGLTARKEYPDSFDIAIGAEISDAVVADGHLLFRDVMLTILDHGWAFRDRMLIISEQSVVEYVPARDWLEPQVVRTVPITDFLPIVDGTQAEFGSRTGVQTLDSVLPNVGLRSADLTKLLAWLFADYSPFNLAKCVLKQQAAP